MKKSKYIKVRKIMMMIVNSLFFHFYCVIKSIKTIFIKLQRFFLNMIRQASGSPAKCACVSLNYLNLSKYEMIPHGIRLLWKANLHNDFLNIVLYECRFSYILYFSFGDAPFYFGYLKHFLPLNCKQNMFLKCKFFLILFLHWDFYRYCRKSSVILLSLVFIYILCLC